MAGMSRELDTYLVNLFEDQLGTGNPLYDGDPLQLQTVRAWIIRDVRDWEGWSLPGLVVMGRDEDREPGEHGDGVLHWDKEYPVMLVGIVEGTEAAILDTTKELQERIQSVIRSHVSLEGLTADGGEFVVDYDFGRTSYQVYPKATGGWFGVCANNLLVNTDL